MSEIKEENDVEKNENELLEENKSIEENEKN